jgi:anti-anti-sigma factor
MEITVKEFNNSSLITIKGRVDSSTSSILAQAFESIQEGGRYKLIVDMGQLEFISSAGFRALLAAQRSAKRYNRGEVVLVQVPEKIRLALAVAGFNELFTIYEDISSVPELAGQKPAGDPTTEAPPPDVSKKKKPKGDE